MIPGSASSDDSDGGSFQRQRRRKLSFRRRTDRGNVPFGSVSLMRPAALCHSRPHPHSFLTDAAETGRNKPSQQLVRPARRCTTNSRMEGHSMEWQGPPNMISSPSHSSGDEGDDSILSGPTAPLPLLELPQDQPMHPTLNDTLEGDGDPRSGNRCNALSGEPRLTSQDTHSRALLSAARPKTEALFNAGRCAVFHSQLCQSPADIMIPTSCSSRTSLKPQKKTFSYLMARLHPIFHRPILETQCSRKFVSLADHPVWSSAAVGHLLHGSTCCAFRDALLLTLVVRIPVTVAFLSTCLSGHSSLTSATNKAFSPKELAAQWMFLSFLTHCVKIPVD